MQSSVFVPLSSVQSTITAVQLTSNIATVNLAAYAGPVPLKIGNIIVIAGLTTTALNGTFTLTSVTSGYSNLEGATSGGPTPIQITFAKTNADIPLTTDSGTVTQLDSGWFDIGKYDSWSILVDAMESGATMTVSVSNRANPPSSDSGFNIANITATSSTWSVRSTGINKWMRLVKSNGGSPAATNVYMFGQLGD
jgi:hypothetical protein